MTRRTLIAPLLLALATFLAAPPAAAQPVSGAEAIDALKQVMRARGLTPPPESDLSLDDYISTNLTAGSGGGVRNVRLWIGPEGRPIPDPEWQQFHPNFCKQQARHTQRAVHALNFETTQVTEELDGVTRTQTFTFAQFIDVESGVIEEQREGEEGAGSRGLVATMTDAWDQMTAPVGALDGPCGEVRVVHVEGTNVGDAFVFQAGFQGGYGQYLNYTWDFGDGSAPVSVGKRARHVYDEEGPYVVSVLVEGEHVEPGTGTVSVVVREDAGLTLFFSSRIEQQFPGGHFAARYESSIPLTASGDATYEGTAPLRNVEYVNTLLANAPGGCRGVPHDGALHARVVLPDEASADGINAFLMPPGDTAIPRADVVCTSQGMSGMMRGFAGTWWPSFAVLHGDEGGSSFHFTDWAPSTDPDVIARTVSTGSRTMEGQMIVEETTIEIRRGAPE